MYSRSRNAVVRIVFIVLLPMSILLAGCDVWSGYTFDEHMERAAEFRERGELNAAAIELKNALQQDPQDAEARWQLGRVYVALGQGSDAEHELRRARDLGHEADAWVLYWGDALVLQNEHQRVLDEVDAPADADTAFVARIDELHGQAYMALGDVDTACGRFNAAHEADPELVDAYWGLARCALVDGDTDGARAHINEALELEPENAQTWALLGDVERGAEAPGAAIDAYSRAIDINPRQVSARLGRAATLIRQNDLEAAESDVDFLLDRLPEYAPALHLRGILAFGRQDYAEAREALETVLRTNRDFAPAALWLGLTHYVDGNYEQAARRLEQYGRANPDAVRVRALLAVVQARIGGREAADETLRVLGETDVQDPESLMALGHAHMVTGRGGMAAQYLRRVVDHDPASPGLRVDLATALLQEGDTLGAIQELEEALELGDGEGRAEDMLIQTLIREGEYDRAREAIDRMEASRPDSAVPHNYRATILLLEERLDEAAAVFEQALELEPGNPAAAHGLARIAANRGDLDKAREHYHATLEYHPDHLPTLLALYAVENAADDSQAAREALERATSAHPTRPEPAALLGLIRLRGGDPEGALEVTRRAAEANPNDVRLLELRGAAHLTSDDPTSALANFQRLARQRPDDPGPRLQQALAHAAMDDIRATRNALRETLDRDPDHVQAKTMLARLELAEGNTDRVVPLARELVEARPDQAEGYVLQAEALGRQDNMAEARRVLQEGRERVPDSDRIAFGLARAQWAQGDHDAAVATMEAWQEQHPDDPRAASFLGESYLAAGREAEAIAAYERVVAQMPENMTALNNLAVLLQERDPERALELARKAHELHPEHPAVLDTLGWTLVLKGRVDEGLPYLAQAYEAAPQSAEIHYHYAAALAEAGDRDRARAELESLLAAHETFPDRDDARRLLDRL